MISLEEFLKLSIGEIYEEYNKPKHPHLKHKRALTGAERAALFRARKAARINGASFDENDWLEENIK